jgi:hypothetical protein
MSNIKTDTKQYFSDTSLITVVITACGRPDLLLRTLDSFFKFNTLPVKSIIISEDSGKPNINDEVKKRYPSLTYIDGLQNVGQIASIDRAYALVSTPYIFHLEEDWELSLDILQKFPKASAVMCLAYRNYLPDPKQPPFLHCGTSSQWGYYSFNPGLRRLSDYKTHCMGCFGKITKWNHKAPVKSEKRINNWFRKRGFRMAILPDSEGYLRHIGTHRHVQV